VKKIKNSLRNIKLTRPIVLFAMIYIINIFSMEVSELPKMAIIQKGKLLEQHEQEKALQYDKSVHTFYIMKDTGKKLYISQKELVNSDDKQVNLKELFKQYNICLGWPKSQWDEKETWQNAYSSLKERATKEKAHYMISSDELPRLLQDAKIILKNFLITNDNNFPIILNTYIKKSGINRLFTYAKLEQVIERKNLTHVRLPQKFLILFDKETNNYIASEKSREIIDGILNFSIEPFETHINITCGTKYDLKIFAQKEDNHYYFNTTAQKELFTLCEEAPFDVGYDNIFADNKGNAVIIDTEFKGESARQAYPKLNRYPIDHKLNTF